MATITIPWEDGSGDNIYLTYSQASGDQTVTVTSDAYAGSNSRTKDVIFTTTNGNTTVSKTLTVIQEEPVPYDSRIEYLESTGTQYIDIGYTPTTSTILIMEACLTSLQNNITMVGLYREKTYVQRFHIGTYQNQWHFGVSSNSASNKWKNFTGGIDTNKHTFEIRASGYCAVDSATNQITVNNSRAYSMRIFVFARNVYVSSITIDQYASMKLYGMKIYEGSTLMHEYIPCRVGQVGYLYDKVTKALLGNSGSGSFTLGSDI